MMYIIFDSIIIIITVIVRHCQLVVAFRTTNNIITYNNKQSMTRKITFTTMTYHQYQQRSKLMVGTSNTNENTNHKQIKNYMTYNDNGDYQIYHDNHMISLQSYHSMLSPMETLNQLIIDCMELNITNDQYQILDRYGDVDIDPSSSYLRNFEKEIANEFHHDDAVFLISGTMAQQIALLVHHNDYYNMKNNNITTTETYNNNNEKQRSSFICHDTCHLLLHENNAYKELINMDAIAIDTTTNMKTTSTDSHYSNSSNFSSISPLLFSHVEEIISNENNKNKNISTLIIELPHREIGGKLTPYNDLIQMKHLCNTHDIKFHCDGARIFEASIGYNVSLNEIGILFDSIYISFYKVLGGLSGAALIGTTEFCNHVRIWQKRFGGTLYTIMPYVISAKIGYEKYYKLSMMHHQQSNILSFDEIFMKLQRIVLLLQSNQIINQIVTFDPYIPETNMIHGYMKYTIHDIEEAISIMKTQSSIQVLHRFKCIKDSIHYYNHGYLCSFELAVGQANGQLSDECFVHAWTLFAMALLQQQKVVEGDT